MSVGCRQGQHNNLVCSVTSATRREQGEWMSSSRLSTNKPAGSRWPRTRLESQRVEESNSNSPEFVEQTQQEADGELRRVLDLSINSSSDEESSDHSNYFTNVGPGGIFEEDTMLYPYSSTMMKPTWKRIYVLSLRHGKLTIYPRDCRRLMPTNKKLQNSICRLMGNWWIGTQHICAFYTTWQANHVSLILSQADADK